MTSEGRPRLDQDYVQTDFEIEEDQYMQIKKSYSEPNLRQTSTQSILLNQSFNGTFVKDMRDSNYMLGRKKYYSLFCLGPENPIRILAIFITESKLFENFILLAILFTCVVMAIDAPLPENDKSEMNKIASQIEYFLLGIFCFEATLKIIAMGFLLHPGAYLRSIWNILDFLVVVTGIVTLPEVIGNDAGSGVNIKPLRAVRVLRPLKLISGIPSLQVVMTSIVRAMFPLLQVLFLVVFVIIIYAIIGLEFFAKRFHYSCYDNKTKEYDNFPCDKARVDKDKFYYVYGRECPSNLTCQRYWTGLNFGITSFDNIFLAMITVFQCITMEGWTDIMYHTFWGLDEHGYIYTLYYISLIVIGSFFMLNLVLGVLSGEFAKEREKVENRREFLKLRYEQQLDRICDHYLAWILKGEDILVQEQSEMSFQNITQPQHDINESVIFNPALVFTKNKYRVKSENHRQSKLERLLIQIKVLRIKTRAFVKHNYFFWAVISMVFINTIIMATRHYQQEQWLTSLQEYAEITFVTIFSFELLLKLFAHGPILYCKSHFNVFDLVVVLLSIMEIILNKTVGNINLGLSVLRCLRLLRAFKVTKYWSSLRNLVTSLMNAMKSILSLMFLLFLFILISALLGMQLFGGKFVKLEKFPRTNFDTFNDSLLAVFQVITGEDWNAVMYNGMMAYGGPKTVEGVCCSLYFIFLVIFGNYTLLNVFLAIAVDNLTNAEILTHDEEAEESKKRETKLMNLLNTDIDLSTKANTLMANLQAKALENGRNSSSSNRTDTREDDSIPDPLKDTSISGSKETIHENGYTNGDALNPLVISNGNSLSVSNTPNMGRRKSHGMFEQVLLETPSTTRRKSSAEKYLSTVQKKWLAIVDYNLEHPESFLDKANSPGSDLHQEKDASEIDNHSSNESQSEDESIADQISHNGILNVMKVNVTNRRRIVKAVPMVQKSSLFILKPTNSFRRGCHQIVNFRYFDWFIMAVIVISSLTLALENPYDDSAQINKVLHYFDYFFTIVFGVEVVLKVIDSGLILHKDAYLRSLWNALDAFVFACNLASIILSNMNVTSGSAKQIVKTLRVLRVLRPLKAIHKVKKLKAVFQCMIYSLKNVTFVLIITFIILFIFACIGVQLYQGKFFYCTDPSKMTKDECQGSYYVFPDATSVVENSPKVKERHWRRYDFHFDNIIDAILTLYTSSTGEGWPTSMHNTMDATKENYGPITNYSPHMAIFYIVFVVIFTFMIINIYIALIILTFQRQGEKEIEGGLDRNQRDCLQFVLNTKPRERYMPANKDSFTYRIWYVVDSSPFEYFIMVLIIFNTLQLMMKYDGNSDSYKEMLTALNIAFTALFCVEATLKIIAYRLNYFKDPWNVFDLLVIMGSLLDILLTQYQSTLYFIDPSMFRLCRAARIAKLLRKGASIRIMLWTFFQSFKALPYVTALIMLLFYIYAIIGMQIFAKIKLDRNNSIHEYNNFRSIISALQVLFRCSTGESWSSLMAACYDNAECDLKYANPGDCGNTIVARTYFSTFIFFCMFLLLNLFVAVIMDNFEYLTRDGSILGPHHLDEFVRCWSEFDPQASGCISHELLYKMLCRLTPPVGFGRKCPKEIAYKRLIRMNMPVNDDGTVSFNTTLLALIRTSLNVYVKGNMFDNDKELRRIMCTLWPKTAAKRMEKILPKVKLGDEDQLTVGKIYCVQLIVMKYRASKGRTTSKSTESRKSSPSMLKRLNTLLSSFRRQRNTDPAKEYSLEMKNSNKVKRNQTFSAQTRKSSQHDNPHHTRDKQLRRRSSWSELPSFFRFNREPSGSNVSHEGEQKADAPGRQQISITPDPTTSKHNGSHVNNNLNKSVNRSGSLRTAPNGNVLPGSQRRIVGNHVHSLQHEPINKGATVKYSSNRSLAKQNFSKSAPPTPRNYHVTDQFSPLSRRENQSVNAINSHRNKSVVNHTSGKDFNEVQSKNRGNFDGSRFETRSEIVSNNSQGERLRSLSDPRKVKYSSKSELSKENLETFNHYGTSASTAPVPDHTNERNYYKDFGQKHQKRTHRGESEPSNYPLEEDHYNDMYHPIHSNQVVTGDEAFKNSDNNYGKDTSPNYYKPSMDGRKYHAATKNDGAFSQKGDLNPNSGINRRPHSPRRLQGDRSSPYYQQHQNEMAKEIPSQQYYEDMISQISSQIERVSEGGTATQQPFNTTPPHAAVDDEDDNDWC